MLGVGRGEGVPARRLDGLLDVHAEVDQVGDRLHVPLRLLVAARRSADQPRPAVARDQVAVERVHRLLPAGEDVRVALLEREATPGPVVQDHAGPAGHDPAAEPGREAVDERDRVPLPVHDAEVAGVAAELLWRRADLPVRGALGVELAPAPGRVGLGQETPERRLVDVARVAAVAHAVAEGELLRLDEVVQRRGRPEAHPAQVEALEQAEHLEHDQPLRRRAGRVDVEAAVAHAQRLVQLGRLLGELGPAEEAALGPGRPHDLSRDLAAVEGVGAAGDDRLDCVGQVGVAPCLARPGRLAVRQVDGRAGREAGQPLGRAGDRAADLRASRDAVTRVPDRRPPELAERPAGVLAVDGQVGVRRAGDRGGVPARERHRLEALRDIVIAAGPAGRLAGAVDGPEPVAPGVVEDREDVAAEPAGAGQRQPLDAGHRQRRVEGVPAPLEHGQPVRGRGRGRRGDHPTRSAGDAGRGALLTASPDLPGVDQHRGALLTDLARSASRARRSGRRPPSDRRSPRGRAPPASPARRPPRGCSGS